MPFYCVLSFVFIIGYFVSKVYGKHLRMEVIASQVSDTCSETFVALTSSAECYTISFVRILSRDCRE